MPQIRWTDRAKSYKSDVHRVALRPRIVNRAPDVGPAVFAKEVSICLDDDRLLASGITIGFGLHGGRSGLAKSRRALMEAQ